jgi:hypothetical protein
VHADDIISPNLKDSVSIVVDEDYKDLQWNRYVVDNFVVLSIDDKQGRWFFNNLKDIKNWCLSRWGISNYNLKQECRIMVVPNKKMLKRFFNLDENHIEFREKDGKVEIVAVWLCLEDENKGQIVDDIPRILSYIFFKDIILSKELNNKKFIEVGVPLLNQSVSTIKNSLKDINDFSLDFLEIDDKKYNALTEEEKKEYNNKSLLLCLMLKKEFGEFNFLRLFFNNENSLDSINKIYGFNKEEFSSSSKRYFLDIKNSIENNTISNRYLNIERSKK